MTCPICSIPGDGEAAMGRAGAHDARRRPSVHRAARVRVYMACSLRAAYLTQGARYGAQVARGIRGRAQAVLKRVLIRPGTPLAQREDLDRVRLAFHVSFPERADRYAVVAQARRRVAREDRVDLELLGERFHPRSG